MVKMTTKTKSRFDVNEGRTTFKVDHLGRKLTFAHPVEGPNTYNRVAEQIDNDKTPSQLYRPTTAETISLIYSALQDKDNKYAQEILSFLNETYLWCFTKNRYVPNVGVYIRDDLSDKLDEEERFVPFGYKIGKQSILELEKNPFVIGNAGEEGAQKLAEIVDKLKERFNVRSYENVDQETTGITGLYSYLDWNMLFLHGGYFDDLGPGYAYGVQK